MLNKIIEIAHAAGDIFRDVHPSAADTTEKNGAADIVTKYDIAVQNYVREKLLALKPDAAFLGEEGEHEEINSEWVYIVDPIDGTTNFVRNMHYSTVAIALAQNGQVMYAVIYNPFTEETFSAERGKGAYLNGERLQVSSRDVNHSIVLCGSTVYDRALTELHFDLMRTLYDTCLDFRRLGSAAQDICKIAQGDFEMFFECRLRPWDFAASSLILEEAGGKISHINGSPIDILHSGSIWATNGNTHDFYKNLPDSSILGE